jgi:hypothetical protein
MAAKMLEISGNDTHNLNYHNICVPDTQILMRFFTEVKNRVIRFCFVGL